GWRAIPAARSARRSVESGNEGIVVARRLLQVGRKSDGGGATGCRSDADVQDGGSRAPSQGGRTREMTTREIHPQAILGAGAKLGEDVKIGAYAVVGEDVELGDGCVLHAHAVVQGPSKFGKNNMFHAFSVVGGDPQDYTFCGERVELVAGDGNVVR